MEGEKTLLDTQVTTGGSGYRTPLGTFAIMRKQRVYQSTVYGSYVSNTSGRTVLSGVDRRKHYNLPGMRFEGAQMNYYLEFASGIGMHAGDLTPYPSSHGCVRLPVDAAKKFFELLDIGCIVRVQTTGRPLAAGATATETELRNYARDHLAHFKCPQRIQFVSELPKTATGKVQKYVLRGKPAISKQ
jgi:hypothetical protein